MNESRRTFALSAAGIASMLVAAFALLSGGDLASIRSSLGAAATVTTTRGDLIRRGASADERVALGTTGHVLTAGATDPAWSAPTVTAAQISDASTASRAVVTAANNAAIRAAAQVASRATIDADGDSPAWTDGAAEGATAAFTGGVATFTAPSGVNVAFTSRARSSVTLAAMGVVDPWRVRLEARLTAYNASGARRAVLSIGSVAGGIIGADYTTGDMAVQAFVLDAGTIAIYDYVSTTFTLRATSSTTLTLDGQDWLALELRGESIRVFRGRGSSRPTTWDLVASATWAGGVGGTWAKSPAYAALAAYRTDTTASVFTATWSSVRLTDLQ